MLLSVTARAESKGTTTLDRMVPAARTAAPVCWREGILGMDKPEVEVARREMRRTFFNIIAVVVLLYRREKIGRFDGLEVVDAFLSKQSKKEAER